MLKTQKQAENIPNTIALQLYAPDPDNAGVGMEYGV